MKNKLLLVILFCIGLFTRVYGDEKLLYSTNFQDWIAFSASAVGATNTVTQTTSFTNESLTFTFSEIQCAPTGTNAKFLAPASTGYLMCAKTATTYFTTSALASMTKIYIVGAATGTNRGFKIWKKSTSETDWVAIYSTAANPYSGDARTITIPGDQTNVQLKFTNLSADLTPTSLQNAYLTDLQIYGNYTTTAPQNTLATSVNNTDAGTVSTSPTGTSFDQGTTISLTANRKFGYQFKEWRDANTDAVVSTANPYTFTLNADASLKAVFSPINTYSLTVNTQGGAPTYLVTASPSGTVVNGQTMYEENTTVTLTANSYSPVMNFINWLTGESSTALTVPMTQNQNVTAMYTPGDYIVGWDFFKANTGNRSADFYSTSDNQTSTLVLRKTDGSTSSWLDKSVAIGGYANRGAAVSWRALSDQYYFQTSFSAKDFTDISITAGMLGSYYYYATQNCQYSLDGINFTTLGTYTMPTANTWYDNTFTLPAEANHADKVYIRWIPDYTSEIKTGSMEKDGTSISKIYISAKAAIYNDGVAPVLSSYIPSNGVTNASTTGKVTLTFDEKVMLTSSSVTATLGSKQITPTILGNTVSFSYTGLDYNTPYTFTLPANSVSDLAGNTLTTPVSINFTTMSRPTVSKKMFDFVVGIDGDFKAAIQAATNASGSGNRFYIFFPNGQYNVGTNTGDANQMTSIALPNVSYIGQSADGVILSNLPTTEGIGTTATIRFTSTAGSNYMQDISLKNNFPFSSNDCRAVALWDQGNKNIYKNIKLISYQDTYYSSNTIRSYFENSEIHGTVDFICGGGDIYFNECLLYLEERSGNVIAAPSTSTNWGYVFSNCTIDGTPLNKGSYSLGRPWQNTPKTAFINTKMNILPTSAGWLEMSAIPTLFAEYNSTTSTGTAVDVSLRKTSYTANGVTTTVNPYLTAEQAALYTVDNVLSGTDSWQPKLYTDQIAAPAISGNGSTISWADNNYVLCWGIFKDGNFVQFVTTNSYSIPSSVTSGTYTVRAANEMGGLGAASNSYQFGAVSTGIFDASAQKIIAYNENGTLHLSNLPGSCKVELFGFDGKMITSQKCNTTNASFYLTENNVILRVISDQETCVFKISKR